MVLEVWSFLLCFLVMTVWSMLMVETLHPLLQQLQECHGAPKCTIYKRF